MTLTCAFDHRIADGAQVAGFLGELRGLIEAPESALLDSSYRAAPRPLAVRIR